MPEQLSQAQIDALLKKMSSGEVAVEEKQTIKEYDLNRLRSSRKNSSRQWTAFMRRFRGCSPHICQGFCA